MSTQHAPNLAMGATAMGESQALGLAGKLMEDRPSWAGFLCILARRGLNDVSVVNSDAYEGLKKGI